MHITASNPLAIDKNGIDKGLVDKELEIIKAEITNSGKPKEMAEKIAKYEAEQETQYQLYQAAIRKTSEPTTRRTTSCRLELTDAILISDFFVAAGA